jgi:hypothetical protein
VHEIVFHVGNNTHRRGSEHAVDGQLFAGELQLIAYNDIYANYTEAMNRAHGLAAISVLIDVSVGAHIPLHSYLARAQIGQQTSHELMKLTKLTPDILYKS